MYENGNEFDEAKGRFKPKETGYFLCNGNVRLDSFDGASSALLISINGKKDKNSGLYTVEGNGGSTNYRSMMVAGTLQLKKGQFASLFIYSSGDTYYRVSTESGFSCHQLDSVTGFHADKSINQVSVYQVVAACTSSYSALSKLPDRLIII